MSSASSDIWSFYSPALCANKSNGGHGADGVCHNKAIGTCANCQLVQYCTKECQKADWTSHKATCTSAIMKDSWQPTWHSEGRQPAFIGGETFATFGALKYLWGNMPALDIMGSPSEADEINSKQDLALFFAASGDLRNVIKTLTSIPDTHDGNVWVVVNDREFIVVARNIMMLLTAFLFDFKVAVPMIIHLWYSAALPHTMIDALHANVLPLIQDVCTKIEDKPDGSIQENVFGFDGNKLRVTLTKKEWLSLADYFKVPDSVTLEKSHEIRCRVTMAPERIDHRDRAMLHWPRALRAVDLRFRQEGILLPFGCSVAAFDTPNPTLFQDGTWPMKDSLSPRDGWSRQKYMEYASVAKADEHGAIFFYLRHLLTRFCSGLRETKVSFSMFCMDAKELSLNLRGTQFDRIEMSNVCDRSFLGPYTCIEGFSPLLKPTSENPKATLLMLFMNAAVETESNNKELKKWESDLSIAKTRVNDYMKLDRTRLSNISSLEDLARHPYTVIRSGCYDLLKDWEYWFDMFLKNGQLAEFAQLFGLKIKEEHTIVEPWPYKVNACTSKEQFDIMRASAQTGYERYMELQRHV